MEIEDLSVEFAEAGPQLFLDHARELHELRHLLEGAAHDGSVEGAVEGLD